MCQLKTIIKSGREEEEIHMDFNNRLRPMELKQGSLQGDLRLKVLSCHSITRLLVEWILLSLLQAEGLTSSDLLMKYYYGPRLLVNSGVFIFR